MPRPNPPRLSKDVDRHSNVRWYVRVPGKLKVRLSARLAESQATPHELMSVTGHKTLEEVERYARAARKPLMADSAMRKLQAGSIIVPPDSEVGQEEQKRPYKTGSSGRNGAP